MYYVNISNIDNIPSIFITFKHFITYKIYNKQVHMNTYIFIVFSL